MLSVALALSGFGGAFGGTQVPADWTCPNVTVIHKVTRGPDSWYNGCMGLTHHTEFDVAGDDASVEGCKNQCYADMNCSLWQVVKTNNVSTCWSGSVVHNCHSRPDEAEFKDSLLGGERIQHGFVKPTPNKTYQILGLRHYPEATGDIPTQIGRCREFCETTISCTVWQFLDTKYGKTAGCYLEHAPGHLALGVDVNGTDVFPLDGENIEHTCPPYVEPEGLPWPWIIAGSVLGLLALGGIIYALTKKTPKVKKTRAVKIETKDEWQELSYLVQAPNGALVEHRSMVKVNDQIKNAEKAGQIEPLLNR